MGADPNPSIGCVATQYRDILAGGAVPRPDDVDPGAVYLSQKGGFGSHVKLRDQNEG